MRYVIAFSLLLSVPAFAQTPPPAAPVPDPAACSRAIAVLQQQRNNAFDEAAQAQVGLAKAQADLAAAQRQIEELKKQKPADEGH